MKNKSGIYLSFILIVTIIVFYPALEGGYLNWDDDQQILNNEDVLNLSWKSIQNYFTKFYVNSYQPLASLSFGIEYYFFGNNPLIPHVTNLFLHLVNVVLVFFFLKEIRSQQIVLNYFIVIVFAIHPLQAELIGWISTRSTLFFGTFSLLTFIFYAKYISENKSKKNYYITILFFLLACLSKASALVLPVILLLFDYLFQRKVSLKLLIEKLPFFLGGIGVAVLSFISRKVSTSQGGFNDYYTFYEKLSIVSNSIFLYLKKTLLANDLFFFYGYPYKIKEETISIDFLLAPIWMVFIMIFCWFLYKKTNKNYKRLWVFGITFFIVNIITVINLSIFSLTFLAERYMYIAILGVLLCITVVISLLIKNTPTLKNGIYIILGVFIINLAIKSKNRAGLWVSDFSLWSFVEKSKDQHATPYRKLGQIYADKKNYHKAVEIYNNGIKINPFSVDLYYWRAKSIVMLNDLEYAKKDLNRVIKANHELKGEAFYEKSLIFKKQHLLDSSMIAMDSARKYNVNKAIFQKENKLVNPNKVNNIVSVILKRVDSLVKIKNFEKAIKEYDNLLLLSPKSVQYIIEKGKLETRTKQWDNAITSFTKVLEIEDANKMARLNRAFIYSIVGEIDASIKDYSFVINNSNTADLGEVYYYRSLVYLKNKQQNTACDDLNKALDLGYSQAQEMKTKFCN